eukprot:351491-Chlamydomonas_euryale.AAC.29
MEGHVQRRLCMELNSAQTFPFGVSGFDVVGRARTGCGKTLGFTLPMVENLLKDKAGGTFKVWTKCKPYVTAAMRQETLLTHASRPAGLTRYQCASRSITYKDG